MRETTGRRQRARSRVDAIDRTHEAQLETELEFRRAERSAIRARERAQRHARRRFVLAVLVLLALLPVAPSLALAGLGAIGIFCTLWRIAFVGDPDLEGIDVSPSFGVFLALAGAIALLYGGYRRMQEP